MLVFTSGGVVTFGLLVGALALGVVGPHFTGGWRFNLVWFECCMVACALLNHALAFWLNGMATPEGRRWQPDGGPHHLQHVEIQSWTPVPLAIGVFAAARTAWVSVAPWVGVAVAVGSVTMWVIFKVLWSRRPPESRFAMLAPPYAAPPGGAAGPTAFRRALLGVLLLSALALIVFLVTRVVLSMLDLPPGTAGS